MYPVTPARQEPILLFPTTARASIKLLVVCLVFAFVPLALYVRVDSKVSQAPVTVQAAGRGGKTLNLQDGRAMRVEYRGDQFSSEALQSGAARARALASVDLDDNGTPDLVSGYANNGSGIVTLQRGNTEAFAPVDDSVFVRIQAGYKPDSLSSIAEIYQVPEPADFVVTGDFNQDAVKDVLVAAHGGGAYLMAGEGDGRLAEAKQIALPGNVTAAAASEFGMSDGKADLAVGVFGSEGPSLLLFPSREGGLSAPLSFPLKAEATAIQFGNVDQDPFLDVVVAAGNEIEIIHGWGRKNFADAQSRVETIDVPNTLRGLALGNFIWDRENRTEIAAQSADGTVSILQLGNLDVRPFSPEEVAVRVRMRGKVTKQTDADILAAASWPAKAESWNTVKDVGVTGVVGGAESSQGLLVSFHISWQQTDELLVLDAGQNKLKIVQQADTGVPASNGLTTDDFSTISLDVTSAPVAVAALPRKVNGERDLVLLGSDLPEPSIVVVLPNATFTVTKTADTNDGFCNADCSLREAVVAANAAPGSTINVPANTYQLTINGTAEAGFCQSPGTGDLDVSANNTTITGAGAATTIIQQTQPNDRVLCVDQGLVGNFVFNMSGVTITGGRETFAVGGGGMVSGAANDNTTVSACTFSNNQMTGASGPGGGGINNLGGSLTVTNCTVGGTSAPGASQLIVAQANSCGVSGGGLSHSPGDPLGGASNGVLTVTGTTFQNNTAASGAAGGGGADVFTHNLGTGSHSFAGSTFLSNKATVGNGGGIIIESLTCTVATTAFTTNAAQGAASHGGGIQVTGGALVLNGTAPTITFSGNTATIAGSSITAGQGVNVSGTNTTIGGDIEIPTNGVWTNNAGSALSPTNVVINGGTFNMNNSTMTVTGNLTLGPGPAVGGTFNGNTGTVNIAGNFTGTAGGAGPATTFNAGTGTFNFNGGGAQAINGTLARNFNNLTVNKGGGSLSLGISVGVISNLTVTAGTFDLVTFTANRTAVGGTLTVSNGATLRFQSATLPTNYSAYTLGATSTVEYYGAGAQTITAVNYGHLTSSSTGARTLANGGTIGIAGVFTPGTNAYTITGSTIDFNGSVAQTIPAFNYNNLTSSNTGARTLANAGTIGIAGAFTKGTNAYTITGSTVDFNGTGAQTVPVFNFNNLTISGARGGATVTLAAGTIGVAATFNPSATAVVYAITGNTFDFNGAGAQSIPAFNYNNLTISGNRAVAITLGNGNVGVAGIFNLSITGNTWTANPSNTVVFNGSALQTIPAFAFFNGLTLSNAFGANLGGNVTVLNGLALNAGALGVGTNTLTLNGAVSFGAGSLTSSPTGTVIYNQQSNGQATVLAANYGNLTFSNFSKTLASSGTISIAGTFTPGTGTGHTITGSTINFNGAGAQTIPGFTYNNLTSTGAVARTLDPVNTIKIAGAFTPGASTYTFTGSTVEYNGAVAQTLPATFTTYNNLTLNNPTTVLGFAGLTVQGLLRVQAGTFNSSSTFNNVQIDLGATLNGTNATTMNVSGNFLNSGTFNGNGNTVNLNGAAAQTVGGTGTSNFSNLTDANTLVGGNGVTLAGNINVANVLALGANNINTSTFTLTMPATGSSTGTGDVVGNVKRTGFVAAGAALSFGNPFNTIKIDSGAVPTDITVNLVKSAPASFPLAVQRTYTITPNGANGPVTLRLHYLESERNGNAEDSTLIFRRFNGTGWQPVTPTSSDFTDNWLEKTGQPNLSPWTFSSTGVPTATSSEILGHIADANGIPVAGAVVNLSGTQTRKTITDANGNYSFANVETSGFYTVRATRANYSFSPQERSFSQLGNKTEAAFTATALATAINPLDTPEYFVRQHYLDFLGREPDEAGFNYWSDQILGCGGDSGCAEVKLTNVSAAYFLSIEFQEKGGLVDGLYRASFDRAPKYAEFIPDSATIGKDVIVGRAGWQQQLAANKQAFLDAFVQRPAFLGVYGGLSNDQYVDQLLTHTGIGWTQAERDALVNGLTSGTLTRAGVLGQIAADQRFAEAKRNETFVMMEYFGYLRRDPDADGYQYWLNKLKQFNGNFEQAEMVKAFIVSIEYRQRFPR